MANWYALFNRDTEQFIGFSPSEGIKASRVLYKQLDVVELDISQYKWDGDYRTGKLVPKSHTKEVIKEWELKEKFIERLMQRFPLSEQIYIIMKQIAAITPRYELTPEFEELKSGLDTFFTHRDERMKFFKDSDKHEFISTEQSKKDFKNAFHSK